MSTIWPRGNSQLDIVLCILHLAACGWRTPLPCALASDSWPSWMGIGLVSNRCREQAQCSLLIMQPQCTPVLGTSRVL